MLCGVYNFVNFCNLMKRAEKNTELRNKSLFLPRPKRESGWGGGGGGGVANVSCKLKFCLFVICQLNFGPFVSCQLSVN